MLNLILASKVEAIPHTQMLKNANGTLFCGSDNPKIASFLAIMLMCGKEATTKIRQGQPVAIPRARGI